MPVLAAGLFSVSALSLPSVLLAGSAGLALVVLVAWVGFLYFKVLRLSGKDRAHGLSVLMELTNLIRAASEYAKASSKHDD
jgi:hypothetical protein